MDIKLMAWILNVSESELLRRADGRIEWMCEHRIGHTVYYPKGSDDVHGCDGCCARFKGKKIEKVSKGSNQKKS